MMLVALVACAGIAKADDRPVTFGQLPVKAQDFIRTNFPDEKISYATKDPGAFDTTYDVVFMSGIKLEFDSKGEWKEIENKGASVDLKFIPEPIQACVNARWEGVSYKKIDRDRRGYEVKLSNRLELKFDTKFNLIEIDD